MLNDLMAKVITKDRVLTTGREGGIQCLFVVVVLNKNKNRSLMPRIGEPHLVLCMIDLMSELGEQDPRQRNGVNKIAVKGKRKCRQLRKET